jgi:hypothetical protein
MKAVYATVDDIPEKLRDEYVEKDGSFVLRLDDEHPDTLAQRAAFEAAKAEAAAAKAKADAAKADADAADGKVKGFRDNNVRLLKELGAESFEDAVIKLRTLKTVDPDEYARLQVRTKELEQEGVRGTGDVTRLVMEKAQAEVAAAVAPLKQKLDEITQREQAAQEALQRTTLENALRDAATKAGVEDKALPDFLSRGLQVFAIKDGEVVALRGDTPIFSRKKPGEGLSPEEWAYDLSEDAPHLFRPSKGGGAAGGGSGPKRKYIGSDPVDFGSNLDAIASGEVVVQQ